MYDHIKYPHVYVMNVAKSVWISAARLWTDKIALEFYSYQNTFPMRRILFVDIIACNATTCFIEVCECELQ